MREKGFPPHYRERAAELEDLSFRLSSLLNDLDKLTDSDPELLGTTAEMRKEIFKQGDEIYSVEERR